MLIYHKCCKMIKIGHMGGSRDLKSLLYLKKSLSDFQSSIVVTFSRNLEDITASKLENKLKSQNKTRSVSRSYF